MDFEKKYYGNHQALLAAHNGHILRQSNLPLAYDKPMGAYLSEALQDDYYPIGLEAGENTFWGWKGFTAWTYHLRREGWLIDLLSSSPDEVVFVDLEDGEDPNAAAMIGRDWSITGIGFGYRRIRSLYPGGLPVRLDQAYAAMLFLRSATPAVLAGFSGDILTMIILAILLGMTVIILRKRMISRRNSGQK